MLDEAKRGNSVFTNIKLTIPARQEEECEDLVALIKVVTCVIKPQRAESNLTINSCLEGSSWTLSYLMGVGDLIRLCLCLLDMQTLGKCFFIQPNYTLQAKVNLLCPECPSPPRLCPGP